MIATWCIVQLPLLSCLPTIYVAFFSQYLISHHSLEIIQCKKHFMTLVNSFYSPTIIALQIDICLFEFPVVVTIMAMISPTQSTVWLHRDMRPCLYATAAPLQYINIDKVKECVCWKGLFTIYYTLQHSVFRIFFSEASSQFVSQQWLNSRSPTLCCPRCHAASHKQKTCYWRETRVESKQFTLSGLTEISRSAVLTDLMLYGSKPMKKTCSGLAGLVLARR